MLPLRLRQLCHEQILEIELTQSENGQRRMLLRLLCIRDALEINTMRSLTCSRVVGKSHPHPIGVRTTR